MNLNYTVTSKRKLQQLVDAGPRQMVGRRRRMSTLQRIPAAVVHARVAA